MTKSELKTGMIVTLRDGANYIVMLNTAMYYNYRGNDNHIVGVTEQGFIPLDDYNEDMTVKSRFHKKFDIMEVKEHKFIGNLLGHVDTAKTIWKRTEKKTYTYAQLKEILGTEFEVIG